MNHEILIFFHFNLTLGGILLLILAVRKPVRSLAGPQQAAKPWTLVFASLLGLLFPARTIHLTAPRLQLGAASMTAAAHPHATLDPNLGLFLVWTAGVLTCAIVLGVRHAAFQRAVGPLSRVPGIEHGWLAQGLAGPAVIGLHPPKIILPSDFFERFTPEEQAVVLAHERAHVAAQDPDFNLFLAILQCLCWFNPLVHIAPYFCRIDQEIARDADVLAAQPKARRTYAEAMLKTQLHSLPFAPTACLWPAGGVTLLKERIAMLKTPRPSRRRRRLATAVLAVLYFGGVAGAWAARPARVEIDSEPQASPTPQAATAQPARPAQSEPVNSPSAIPPQVTVSNSVIRDYEPQKGAPIPVMVTAPRWTSTPDLDTLAAATAAILGPGATFPDGGSAMMNCTVSRDGTLNSCSLVSQSSDDVGKVALALAPSFKMQPGLDANGAPIDGAKVNIPFRFQGK
jgi:beta-lactamase regulating signal transducer with metallopeptidase domain